MAASTALCAYDASFSAGLLEAASQVACSQQPVLLIAYDAPYPEPMASVRVHGQPFGVALLLTPNATDASLAVMTLKLDDVAVNQLARPGLEKLRCSSPAGRALPLLETIAKNESATIALDYLSPTALVVDLAPCKRP